jgi:hypothetical protein
MTARASRVAAVWRGDVGAVAGETRNDRRLAPIFAALRDVGVAVEAVLYSDGIADDMFERLTGFDGVLVWVDPVSNDGDRTVLDGLLREVAAAGTWVSAHPDTILKMGTKEVLYRTRELSWGGDTRMYSTIEEFRERFRDSLSSGQPRVVKQNRGNGGIGVWKVTLLDSEAGVVRVQHAAPRDDVTEDVTLAEFMDRCAPYLSGTGRLIDQRFETRLADGMIRAYLVEREVVGFAHQQPALQAVGRDAPEPDRVLGMLSAKTMYHADEPRFRVLRARLEREWVPQLLDLVDVNDAELPVLWDADFLYGPRTREGDDTYMLCETNVSSVIPFPDDVPTNLARAVKRRCDRA